MSEPEKTNGQLNAEEPPFVLRDADGPIPTFGPAKVDERGRLLPISDEEKKAEADAIRRMFAVWDTIPDDDPPGMWKRRCGISTPEGRRAQRSFEGMYSIRDSPGLPRQRAAQALACDRPGKPRPIAVSSGSERLSASGVRVIIPEIIDYEVRRELIRIGSTASLRRLDALKIEFEYLPLDTVAMLLAAEFWAIVRRQGRPTAPPEAIDVDCILAAQAETAARPGDSSVIATTNVAHLVRFPGVVAPALGVDQLRPAASSAGTVASSPATGRGCGRRSAGGFRKCLSTASKKTQPAPTAASRDQRDHHQDPRPEAGQPQPVEPLVAHGADRQVDQVDAVAPTAAGPEPPRPPGRAVQVPERDQGEPERRGHPRRAHRRGQPVHTGPRVPARSAIADQRRFDGPLRPLARRPDQPPVDGQADGELVPEVDERPLEAEQPADVGRPRPGTSTIAAVTTPRTPEQPPGGGQQGQEADQVELLLVAERPGDPREDLHRARRRRRAVARSRSA